eukprot:8324414-Lingulodinium_polyedra.AAC.1
MRTRGAWGARAGSSGPVCCGHGPGRRDASAAALYSLSDRWARHEPRGCCRGITGPRPDPPA